MLLNHLLHGAKLATGLSFSAICSLQDWSPIWQEIDWKCLMEYAKDTDGC